MPYTFVAKLNMRAFSCPATFVLRMHVAVVVRARARACCDAFAGEAEPFVAREAIV